MQVLDAASPAITEDIKTIEAHLSELKGIDNIIANLRQKITAITQTIRGIEENFASLRDKQKQIADLEKRRVSLFADIMVEAVKQRLYLQSIIAQFEVNKNELLLGIAFEAAIDMSRSAGYMERIADKVDGRVHSAKTVREILEPRISSIHTALSDGERNFNNLNQDAFESEAQEICSLAGILTRRKSTSEADFLNALLTPFFQIGLHIEFNKRPLEALSMGERAVVLLKILLGLDDRPLLIDQPEEHLDNRYIYDELTPAFRNAKARRQIIIATHNANLVVNTDAEQIIVAEHVNGTLSYRTGTLEDIGTREQIKRILEGGDQAFKKREEKYGYRF